MKIPYALVLSFLWSLSFAPEASRACSQDILNTASGSNYSAQFYYNFQKQSNRFMFARVKDIETLRCTNFS
ncbi:MAG: hypothetical protein AB8B56_20800 [Crocinitomicaceae bacterium]